MGDLRVSVAATAVVAMDSGIMIGDHVNNGLHPPKASSATIAQLVISDRHRAAPRVRSVVTNAHPASNVPRRHKASVTTAAMTAPGRTSATISNVRPKTSVHASNSATVQHNLSVQELQRSPTMPQ